MTPFPAPTVSTPTPIEDADPADPARFLRDLDALLPLTAGTSVALVERASTDQRIVAAARLHGDLDDEEPTSHDSRVLHDLARELFAGQDEYRRRPVHCFVTVVARPGRCVFRPGDVDLLTAWRYSNHVLPVFSGDLLLVTPSGWRSFFDHSAGARPALRTQLP